MKTSFYITTVLLLFGCGPSKSAEDNHIIVESNFNMTDQALSELKWLNQPQSYETSNNSLFITVGEGSDFFNNPEDSSIVGSAPILYKEQTGDFIAKALVEPDFSAQWNAVSLMVYMDSLNWIKFAYENSDATGPSIVSVVTKGSSDDANGGVLNEDKVWLAIARKGNIYSMHWSIDGKIYKMTRLTSMPDQTPVKVGIEAQSPVGSKAIHQVHYFEVEDKTIKSLRNINE